MDYRRVLFSLISLTALSAGAQDTSDLKRAMIGSWRSSDGQVVEFRADNTYRMYPKCGPETEAWKKRGIEFLPATWELVNGDHLKLTVAYQGKSRTFDLKVAVANDEMRGTDENGQTNAQRRYVGVLPPTCPPHP